MRNQQFKKCTFNTFLLFFRFFSYVNENHLFHRPTYSTFISLLNNYHYMTGTSEYQTSAEEAEVSSFLSQISQTRVMELTQQFLHSKGSSHISLLIEDLQTKVKMATVLLVWCIYILSKFPTHIAVAL